MAIIDDPSAYFQTTLYTGNGGTNAITNTGNSDLQPDWIWFKRRDGADNHIVFDVVRGVTKAIYPDLDNLEDTLSNSLSSFNSDGFTLGADTASGGSINGSSETCVAWQWKAGTSVSGTTTGSGTGKAYTGSVNTDAGFSIIRYLGNSSAGHTIPHNLGAVPKMIIGHGLTGSDTTSWTVYHQSLGATKTVSLNERAAASTSTVWNNTTPTSSVVSLGSSGNVNDNDDAFILYSFAEKQGYSKISSYVGNGNADGTFVYTGFKPAWLMAFHTTAGNENWMLVDNKRDGFNVENEQLFPNTNIAEESNDEVDLLSNGFKLRRANTRMNGSGATYIFMAFAENPFVASNFVTTTAR